MKSLSALLIRDLRVVFRQPGDLLQPLVFFVMVVALFPLAISPEKELLQTLAPGVIWVAALLSTLVSLEMLFKTDFRDGTLEQQVLAPVPLSLLVFAKVLAHWTVSGLPLVLLSPVLGLMFFVNGDTQWVIIVGLLMGTLVFSFIGAIGAALTVGLKKGGVLLSILVLPLYLPVLIFASSAATAAGAGLPVAGHLAILGAILALTLSLAPLAIAVALRISLSS